MSEDQNASIRKLGYIADIVEDGKTITRLTPKGAEVHAMLSIFADGKKLKIRKQGTTSMDDVMIKVVKFGKGMNQLMEGLGKMGGEPVKMNMSNMTNFGAKPKTRKRPVRKKRRRNG